MLRPVLRVPDVQQPGTGFRAVVLGSHKLRAFRRHRASAVCVVAALSVVGCDWFGERSSLSKSEDESALPLGPPPPENGPKLGALANRTPIFERPSLRAPQIGALHAGALVARSTEPVRRTNDCESGFYSVFPRGFVCLDQGATTDLAHPTLAAMSIRPALDQALPYTYARTRAETPLLERDPARDAAVREARKLPKGSGFAVVGSWMASLDAEEPERLGLLTNGRFARARDLEAADASTFTGYELGEDKTLPVAFVVKRGVNTHTLDGEQPEKGDTPLEYHSILPLAGRYRTVGRVKYWLTRAEGERWVREQDVTIIHRRTKFPEFAREGQRWLDVSVLLGTVIAYEGEKPVFATLISAGRDRLGNAEIEVTQAITKLGTFEIVSKSATLLDSAPDRAHERYLLFDVPWALELSSGQYMYGAYWHDRFGIEHGPGDLMLSPADARHIWEWATPALPNGWHSATAGADKTIVLVRK